MSDTQENFNEKQALFELIVRSGPEAFNAYRRETNYLTLDLSGVDFTGKDMAGINLSNVNLMGCTFDFAYMAESVLIMADLSRSSCRETDFYMATLEEAELHHCNLQQANFSSASLSDATFNHCQANDTRFLDADLSRAKFRKAQLNDADFTGAILKGADFTEAESEWAIFEDVQYDAQTRWGKHPPAFIN